MAQVSKSKPTTRTVIRCPVFGSPADVKQSMLPTNADVMKCYNMIQNKIRPSANKKATVTEVSEVLSRRIELLWSKASIPVISHKRVLERIKLLHDRYRNILKPYSSRKNDPKYTDKIQHFAEEATATLFDIAACKCCDISLCHCANDKKVPIAERGFLVDQRGARKMMIGHIDVKATNRLKRKHSRQQSEATRVKRHLENSLVVKETDGQSDSSDVEASGTPTALQTEEEIDTVASETSLTRPTDEEDIIARVSGHLEENLPSTSQHYNHLKLSNVA